MSDDNETFLEGDNNIPGQNFVCLSFLSPEEVMKSKEVYMFHRYMTQRFGELEQSIDKITKNAGDELKTKINKELKDKLRLELQYTYDQFKGRFEDFTYKFHDELEKEFSEKNEYRTSVRGVKIRGVYETQKEAEIKAKQLQKRDRTFHVFVGSVGQWLPWDPCADRVQSEEYLEDELNNLMKEYKKNEVNKDMFYEDQKRERKEDAMKERIQAEKEMTKQDEENKKNMATIEEHIESNDPWMERKNQDAVEGTEGGGGDDADGSK
jgi:hypothetical protein